MVLTSPSMVSFQASGSLVCLGNQPVVADEELGRGRGIVVEQMLRRLGHQRLVAQNDQVGVLARETAGAAAPWARRCGRSVLLAPARTPPAPVPPASCRRTRSSRRPPRPWPQARPRPGTRAARVRPAAEYDGIGALRIVLVKLVDQPSFSCPAMFVTPLRFCGLMTAQLDPNWVIFVLTAEVDKLRYASPGRGVPSKVFPLQTRQPGMKCRYGRSDFLGSVYSDACGRRGVRPGGGRPGGPQGCNFGAFSIGLVWSGLCLFALSIFLFAGAAKLWLTRHPGRLA